MIIELETLRLVRYSSQEYRTLKEELENGGSSSEYIHQIGERLELSKDNDRSVFQSAFVVLDGNIPIGYLFISSMMRDEVFLEYAVLKEFRGMGYASDMVMEVSNYLFQNYNIRSIRLDIDPSNEKSILVANSCGFVLDEELFESRNFVGKMQFIKESDCYVSKRRTGSTR